MLEIPCSLEQLQSEPGIKFSQPLCRALYFGRGQGILSMQDLALKIGLIHGIEFDKPQLADSSRRQIQGDRGSQAAATDEQDGGLLEFHLGFLIHSRQDELARITLFFPVSEIHGEDN